MAAWIKMSTALRTHPKTVAIAASLRVRKALVVGLFHHLWSLADEHTEDGRLVGYTGEAVDEEVGHRGFAAAVAAQGWLDLDRPGCVVIPRFEEHNGDSAKRRAESAKRAAKCRSKGPRADAERASRAQSVAHSALQKCDARSANGVTKCAPREDKRREEEEKDKDLVVVTRPRESEPAGQPQPGRSGVVAFQLGVEEALSRLMQRKHGLHTQEVYRVTKWCQAVEERDEAAESLWPVIHGRPTRPSELATRAVRWAVECRKNSSVHAALSWVDGVLDRCVRQGCWPEQQVQYAEPQSEVITPDGPAPDFGAIAAASAARRAAKGGS